MIQSLKCLVLIISITGVSVGNVFAFQEEIDWMWNDTKPTARGGPACMKYIVKAYPIKIFRKNVSGQTCIENAIESYRKGDQEEALGWILAGQCHNRLARETLVKHAPKVLEYVLQTYGKELREKKASSSPEEPGIRASIRSAQTSLPKSPRRRSSSENEEAEMPRSG